MCKIILSETNQESRSPTTTATSLLHCSNASSSGVRFSSLASCPQLCPVTAAGIYSETSYMHNFQFHLRPSIFMFCLLPAWTRWKIDETSFQDYFSKPFVTRLSVFITSHLSSTPLLSSCHGSPLPWYRGVADALETCPTCVIIPNFVALGQNVWA